MKKTFRTSNSLIKSTDYYFFPFVKLLNLQLSTSNLATWLQLNILNLPGKIAWEGMGQDGLQNRNVCIAGHLHVIEKEGEL